MIVYRRHFEIIINLIFFVPALYRGYHLSHLSLNNALGTVHRYDPAAFQISDVVSDCTSSAINGACLCAGNLQLCIYQR